MSLDIPGSWNNYKILKAIEITLHYGFPTLAFQEHLQGGDQSILWYSKSGTNVRTKYYKSSLHLKHLILVVPVVAVINIIKVILLTRRWSVW